MCFCFGEQSCVCHFIFLVGFVGCVCRQYSVSGSVCALPPREREKKKKKYNRRRNKVLPRSRRVSRVVLGSSKHTAIRGNKRARIQSPGRTKQGALMPQPGHSMASTSKRRVSSRAKPTVVDTEVEEPGSMSMLWKEAFPVGTEWDQYDKVYEIDWDFSNLEEAFEEGGKLHGQRVYLFGCTEPQLIHFKDASRVIHIPAVVAVTSPFPPSDKIGIKSVQREDELIVPMKEMKMGWVPYLPPQVRDNSAVERYKAQVFTLKCTQRRAALKQLKQERIKKYEYCLPYIYSPLKEDETIDETVVNIMYPMEDDAKPPVVTEFDWQFDEVEVQTESIHFLWEDCKYIHICVLWF